MTETEKPPSHGAPLAPETIPRPFPIEEFRILGVKINALTAGQAGQILHWWIRRRQKQYVVVTGAHGIVEMQHDRELRRINNRAGLVTPDGMPAVWLGKLMGFRTIEKVSGPEVMSEAFRMSAERGYRHFFYGGAEGVAQELAERVRTSFPGIQIAGTYCPPFRPLTSEEVQRIAAMINDAGPDIVWCGLGCPRQERWMAQFRPLLHAPVLAGVGAGFDFLAGRKPLAPQWMRRAGLEWLHRLLSDPRRLWRRYARIIPLFLWYVVLEKLRLYDPEGGHEDRPS